MILSVNLRPKKFPNSSLFFFSSSDLVFRWASNSAYCCASNSAARSFCIICASCSFLAPFFNSSSNFLSSALNISSSSSFLTMTVCTCKMAYWRLASYSRSCSSCSRLIFSGSGGGSSLSDESSSSMSSISSALFASPSACYFYFLSNANFLASVIMSFGM